ncbi:hypothetical protein VNO78_31498 [Psophocarpus tetragonolobus]|uniref:Uncharacterized protein n=1 Tax=Psophocarpus tetragonolobus TaxID=3891 RepID=A0AAN9RZA6_PSOTE
MMDELMCEFYFDILNVIELSVQSWMMNYLACFMTLYYKFNCCRCMSLLVVTKYQLDSRREPYKERLRVLSSENASSHD